jgi:hypothetical protein
VNVVEDCLTSQVRLIGTTVTVAEAEQTEPGAVQAGVPLNTPVALVTLTVFWTVPAVLYVAEANAVNVVFCGIELGIGGEKTKPVLSLITTPLRSS